MVLGLPEWRVGIAADNHVSRGQTDSRCPVHRRSILLRLLRLFRRRVCYPYATTQEPQHAKLQEVSRGVVRARRSCANWISAIMPFLWTRPAPTRPAPARRAQARPSNLFLDPPTPELVIGMISSLGKVEQRLRVRKTVFDSPAASQVAWRFLVGNNTHRGLVFKRWTPEADGSTFGDVLYFGTDAAPGTRSIALARRRRASGSSTRCAAGLWRRGLARRRTTRSSLCTSCCSTCRGGRCTRTRSPCTA